MSDLIKALQIFLKYGDLKYPTHCEHDELRVYGYPKDKVSEEDRVELDRLGFFWSDDDSCFVSYRYGSC